jgi:glycosyltransferase involved in cell wall biosynthesis
LPRNLCPHLYLSKIEENLGSTPAAAEGRRILLLITDLQIGGTPAVVRELAVRLNDPPRAVVDVACLAGHGPVVDQSEAAGIRVTALGARRASDLGIIPRLFRLISTNRYDTVFSFLLHANAAAAMVKPFCHGVRFLQSIQTTQPNPKWHWWLQSVVHHAADRIVVPSPSVAHVAADWADIPRNKITVIPNAIDGKDFVGGTGASLVPYSEHGRGARATKDKAISIGFIGRLDPIKRIPDLLHAMSLLPHHVHLDIYGQGSERRHIESLIRQLNLSKRVTLHGSIARPQEAFAGMSLLVLPSAAEGFGLVLIEAMAAGVPIVATNVPGICDVVRNGETGLLVPPASPSDLAGAIEEMLHNPAMARQLAATARADISRRFTWDVVLPQYGELLSLRTRPVAGPETQRSTAPKLSASGLTNLG